jgi:hypothetical protein
MRIIHRGYLYEAIDRQIVVYHRTSDYEAGVSIGDIGYNIDKSHASLYGKGFYACTKLEDIIQPTMCEKYGEYILKCRLISSNFLYADNEYDSSVNNESIDAQLRSKLSSSEYSSIVYRDYLKMNITGGASIQNLPDIKILSKYFSGMFYRGSNWQHGPAMSNVVAWDVSSIVPLAYSDYCVDGEYNEADISRVEFEAIPSRAHAKNSLDQNINQGLPIASIDVSSFIDDFRKYVMDGFSEYDTYDAIKNNNDLLAKVNSIYADSKVSEMKKIYDHFKDPSMSFSDVEKNVRSNLSFSKSDVLQSPEVVNFLRKIHSSEEEKIWKYISENRLSLLGSAAIGWFFKLILSGGREAIKLSNILFSKNVSSVSVPEFLSKLPSNVLINASKHGWIKLYKWMVEDLPSDVKDALIIQKG